MPRGNVKPRTIQADDETWTAFQDIAWARRLSGSKLFREWVVKEKGPKAIKPRSVAASAAGGET
jgi:hypothetical protein